jgi:hypothetical protein
MHPDELFAAIADAVRDVLFHSESSYPALPYRPGLVTEGWPLDSLEFAEAVGLDEERPMDSKPFGEFIDWRLDENPEFFDATEIENARRVRKLAKLLRDNLYNVRVFRLGSPSGDDSSEDVRGTIECFAVGRHDSGEVLGFRTTIVET